MNGQVAVLPLAAAAGSAREPSAVTKVLDRRQEGKTIPPKRRTIGMLTVCMAVAATIGIASADWVTATVPTGANPCAVAVNPVTSKTYVANRGSDNVTVITDAPVNDTRVRVAFDRLPGDTSALARPTLTGKGVNRSTPSRTEMMGVGNRMNTAQTAWDWATVTSGAGTDSITWTYNWSIDSLIAGENFVCCVPLEDQAATTNNLGLGTPFAGNLAVFAVYRMTYNAGMDENSKPQVASSELEPTIIRSVLYLGDCPRTGTVPETALLDGSGRKVLDLHPGANDVRTLAPGVYFVRMAQAQAQAQAIRKVIKLN
jgi:hypothetical protein